MWPELTEYVLGGGQPLLAAVFFLLAIWLLLSGRIWSKSRGLGAPPARLVAAFQAPRGAPLGQEGWLWRAATADRDDEVVECLERVLELNPFSEKARGGLTEARRRLGQERGRTAS